MVINGFFKIMLPHHLLTHYFFSSSKIVDQRYLRLIYLKINLLTGVNCQDINTYKLIEVNAVFKIKLYFLAAPIPPGPISLFSKFTNS